jgi:uncharacterized protein
MTTQNVDQTIGLFEIACRDGDLMRQFYERVFDWRFSQPDEAGYSQIDGGSGNGVGGLLHQEQHGPIETLIYVRVPDLAKALADAEELGGKTIVPPTSTVGSRRIAQFEDPEGNIIGLVQG